MPELKIRIPKEEHERLKELAKKDYRSLTSYITVALIKLANSQFIDVSQVPENTTIKTTTTKTLTPEEEEEAKLQAFQKMAKQIVGHEIDIEQYRILDAFSDHTYYDRQYEKPIRAGADVKCVCIYDLPLSRQRQYLEEEKAYEDRHK